MQLALIDAILPLLKQTKMERSELQHAYIDEIIDGMDLKDMCALLHDLMDKDLDIYTDEELRTEVEEYYPHLLEG